MRATQFYSTDWADPKYERACLLPFFVRGGETYYGLFAAPGSLRLSVVGGTHEPDKDSDLLDTLRREAEEELGHEFEKHVLYERGYSFDLNRTLCLAAPLDTAEPLRALANDELLCAVWMPLSQLKSIIRARRLRVSTDLRALASLLPRLVPCAAPELRRVPLSRPLPVRGGTFWDAQKVLSTSQARYRVYAAVRGERACLVTSDGSFFFLSEIQLKHALRGLREFETEVHLCSDRPLSWLCTRSPRLALAPDVPLADAAFALRAQEALEYATRPPRKASRRRDRDVIFAIAEHNEALVAGFPPETPAKLSRAQEAAVRAGAYSIREQRLVFP